MWYEVKVKYSKIDDNEKIKTFNQPYLFDALTFTEAEARATEEMGKYLSEGFKITLKSPYKEFYERIELELSLYEKFNYSDILTQKENAETFEGHKKNFN